MGWFNARLKNMRGAQKKLTTNNNSNRRSARRSKIPNPSDDVIYLKSLVVSDENMPIFIEKLNSTRGHRMEMLLDKNIHLKEMFPYFFTHPDLVIRPLCISCLQFFIISHYSTDFEGI